MSEAAADLQMRRRTVLFSYGALCSLVAVKAVVAQALPILLSQLQEHPERVAETLSTVAAASAALEFTLSSEHAPRR